MACQPLSRALALYLCLFASICAANQCYYPDGNPSNDVPCTSQKASACCNVSSICLENGLCLSPEQQPFGLSRGSCSEKHWSGNCPQFCKKYEPRGGARLTMFNNTATEVYYCCGPVVMINGVMSCARNADGTSQTPFPVDHGHSSLMIYGAAILKGAVKSSSSSGANTTTPSCNNTCPNNVQDSSSSHDAAIGAGVGIPLGIIALLSIAWALWERRKRHQATNMSVPKSPGYSQLSPGYSQTSPGYGQTSYSERSGDVELPGSTSRPIELDGRTPIVGTHTLISRSSH